MTIKQTSRNLPARIISCILTVCMLLCTLAACQDPADPTTGSSFPTTAPSPTDKPTETTPPAPTDPAPTKPAPTEPTPTEPAPTEPAPTEPAPTEPAPTEPAPTEDSKLDYQVKVTDASGAPMASVMVQVCHSNGCFAPAMTNSEGVATFHLAEGQDYKATFTAVPEGYTAETAEVYFEGATELTLVLTAA